MCDLSNGSRLAAAESNSAFGEIVGSQLNRDLVASKDADVMFAHFAGDMGNDHMAVFQLNTEQGIGQRLDNSAFHFNMVFFGHAIPLW